MELFGLRGANVNVVNVLLDSPWISEVSGPVGFPYFFKWEHELLHRALIVIFTEAEVMPFFILMPHVSSCPLSNFGQDVASGGFCDFQCSPPFRGTGRAFCPPDNVDPQTELVSWGGGLVAKECIRNAGYE